MTILYSKSAIQQVSGDTEIDQSGTAEVPRDLQLEPRKDGITYRKDQKPSA